MSVTKPLRLNILKSKFTSFYPNPKPDLPPGTLDNLTSLLLLKLPDG